MTFEEIREMVNATINENGLKQITGKTLNLALTETLAAIEEFLANNAGGGGLETVYLYESEETITQEQQAANAAVFAKAKAAYEAGKPLPGVQLYFPSDMVGGPGSVGCALSAATSYVAPDTAAAESGTVGLMIKMMIGSNTMTILVNEDGTLTMVE